MPPPSPRLTSRKLFQLGHQLSQGEAVLLHRKDIRDIDCLLANDPRSMSPDLSTTKYAIIFMGWIDHLIQLWYITNLSASLGASSGDIIGIPMQGQQIRRGLLTRNFLFQMLFFPIARSEHDSRKRWMLYYALRQLELTTPIKISGMYDQEKVCQYTVPTNRDARRSWSTFFRPFAYVWQL